MNKLENPLKLDTVPVLLVFLIFAMSALIVLMLGARIYRNMSDTINLGQDEQTSLEYIRTKIRSCDAYGNVSVGEFCGQKALCLNEQFEGNVYRTVIYHHQGYMRELFFEEGLDFTLDDGLPVISCGELSFEAEGGVLRVGAGAYVISVCPRTLGHGEAEVE